MTRHNDYRSSDPDYRRADSDHEPSISRDSPDESRERFHDHPDQPPESTTERSFGAGRLKEDYGESHRKPKNLADLPALGRDEVAEIVNSSNDSLLNPEEHRSPADNSDDANTAIGQEGDTNS